MLAANPSPKTLVSGAAVGVYGLEQGDAILDDHKRPGTDFLAQVVVDWEATANEATKGGVRVAAVRTGLILEPESGLPKQLLPVFKLGGGGPLAGGDQYMPWIHIDDEVGLILWKWLRGRRLRHGKPPRDASPGTPQGLHLPLPRARAGA